MRIVNWTECGCLSLLNKAAERVPSGKTKVRLGYYHPYREDFDNYVEIDAENLYSYPDETNEIVESIDDDGMNFDDVFGALDEEHKVGVLRAADLIVWVQTIAPIEKAERLGDDWLVEIEQEILDSGSKKFTLFDVGTQNHLIDKANGTYIYYADMYGEWKLTEFI